MHLDSQARPDYAKSLAEDIRADMREATDCEGKSVRCCSAEVCEYSKVLDLSVQSV
jgi:hypothetical protein